MTTIFFCSLYIRYAQRNDGLIVTYIKSFFFFFSLSDYPTQCVGNCVPKLKVSLV